ncbi:MAG: CopG family transcriptional regulator [Bryobacterales bacterium]|nr:CopG family transcriptional regulator [Bryobacterales bacterium]
MMVRTQIQLPDQLYARIKELCSQREWTLAEAMRRAAEQLVETHPISTTEASQWKLPTPKQLGPFLAKPEDWRELANQ